MHSLVDLAVRSFAKLFDDRELAEHISDISQHARSKFIQRVSQVTLKDFMDNFNALATEAQGQEDDEFYTKRGVRIHSLEVTAYRCQDASTARILEQIIQETTNRMNRLSQQESENEIKMFALTGEIEQETRRADLLKVLQNHKLMEAQNEGEAEAERVKAFLTATEGAVTNLDTRVGLWNVRPFQGHVDLILILLFLELQQAFTLWQQGLF